MIKSNSPCLPTDYNSDDINALSWTFNPEKALWLSKRFNSEGTVYEAQIDKTHIIALFNARNTSEIIVEPRILGIFQNMKSKGLSLIF